MTPPQAGSRPLPPGACFPGTTPVFRASSCFLALRGLPGPHTVLQQTCLPTSPRAASGLTSSTAKVPAAGGCTLFSWHRLGMEIDPGGLAEGSLSGPYAALLGQQMRKECHLGPPRQLREPFLNYHPVPGWIPCLRDGFLEATCFS